jgi:hypothetical protein
VSGCLRWSIAVNCALKDCRDVNRFGAAGLLVGQDTGKVCT